jgi:hypothetical protein
MCSLPVPKQFVVSLQSLNSFAQWPNCRTWQSAHGIILVFFHSWAGFQAAAVPPNSSVGTKSCCLRSTASR